MVAEVCGLIREEVTDSSINFPINTLLSLRKEEAEEFITRTACRLRDPNVSGCFYEWGPFVAWASAVAG